MGGLSSVYCVCEKLKTMRRRVSHHEERITRTPRTLLDTWPLTTHVPQPPHPNHTRSGPAPAHSPTCAPTTHVSTDQPTYPNPRPLSQPPTYRWVLRAHLTLARLDELLKRVACVTHGATVELEPRKSLSCCQRRPRRVTIPGGMCRCDSWGVDR
jgi:hypothetical protein